MTGVVMSAKRRGFMFAAMAVALATVVTLRVVHAVDERPNLILPGGGLNKVVLGVPGWMYPKYVASGGPVVCLDGPGKVHVDSISAMQGKLKIQAFTLAAIDSPPSKPIDLTGDRIGTIQSSGLPPNPKALTMQCKANIQHFYELLLEVWATPTTERAEGLVVRYTRANGTKDVLEMPSYTIVMCAQKGGPYC
jgi:hypothetical protein